MVEPAENVAIEVYGLGTVEARVQSEIGFQVGGTLLKLAADHGDRVPADAVTARLESGAQEARLTKAAAGVALARAALDQAQARLERARAILAEKRQINKRRQELVSHATVSVEAAEEAQTAAQVAAADVAVAQSEVELAAAALEDARASANLEAALFRYDTLAAPYDGVIVTRHTEPGRRSQRRPDAVHLHRSRNGCRDNCGSTPPRDMSSEVPLRSSLAKPGWIDSIARVTPNMIRIMVLSSGDLGAPRPIAGWPLREAGRHGRRGCAYRPSLSFT